MERLPGFAIIILLVVLMIVIVVLGAKFSSSQDQLHQACQQLLGYVKTARECQ